MTDFQNDMYRRYLASGQAEKAEAFRQAGADQRGAELAQTEAEVREAALIEALVKERMEKL